MIDLLVPRTDAGVAVQALIAVVLLAAAHYVVRNRSSEYRVFVTGLTLLVVAGFGLRMLH